MVLGGILVAGQCAGEGLGCELVSKAGQVLAGRHEWLGYPPLKGAVNLSARIIPDSSDTATVSGGHSWREVEWWDSVSS